MKKIWPSKKEFLLTITDGDEEVLNHPFDYGHMHNEHPYVLVWRAGLHAGCFSLDEEALAQYILEKANNGDDSEFDVYNKDLKEMNFKLNISVELKEKHD